MQFCLLIGVLDFNSKCWSIPLLLGFVNFLKKYSKKHLLTLVKIATLLYKTGFAADLNQDKSFCFDNQNQ